MFYNYESITDQVEEPIKILVKIGSIFLRMMFTGFMYFTIEYLNCCAYV